MTTEGRKADHLRISIEDDPSSRLSAGFDGYHFLHNALPECALDEVSTATHFLGRALAAPLLISCMTGGTEQARGINRALARAAQRHGFAMGLGSGRALLENEALLPTFDVRDEAPDVPLLANLGAVQLNYGVDASGCARLVRLLRADALVLHLNALQEALQPEGDTNFAGLLEKIRGVCASLDVPVIVKEVGWGIGPDEVGALVACGVAGIDVSGAGGTSWSEVERHRSQGVLAEVARAFRTWGIPTAKCIVPARAAAPQTVLIASGGISSGIDATKAIALGADIAGIARPFLLAADRGDEALDVLAEALKTTMRTAMFCIGVRTVGELRGTPRLV